jgi:DNA-directed RNA polymerase specialized sigma24 family protein
LNSSDNSSEPPDSTDPDETQKQPPDETPKPPPTDSDQPKRRWVMTQAAFDKLLERFSSDREEAGIQYETVRRKLIRFFEWNSVARAEDWSDEVINRVARRIYEGQNIDNIMAYIWGVARIVLKEAKKEGDRGPISLDDAPPIWLQKPAPEIIEPDERQLCFDRCLEALPADNRKLILGYYQGKGAEKIRNRQELADELSIPLNALRIRVHRIRKTLEQCIAECLQGCHQRNE